MDDGAGSEAMNTFESALMYLTVVLFIGMSLVMALAPDRVAEYVRNSRTLRAWYRWFLGVQEGEINARTLKIRLQGIVGLLCSLLLCAAVFQRLTSG